MSGSGGPEAADDDAVGAALDDFVAAVRSAYGDRLKGLYLFGSRARGDHTAASDADLAVVLADGSWRAWDEKMALADLEYDVIVATGIEPQGWPLRESEWRHPEKHRNPDLVRAMRRDAVDLLVAG